MRDHQRIQHDREYQRRNPSAHGSGLRNFRRGRGARPLSPRFSMHFTLKSSRAVGSRSFKRPVNERRLRAILTKFTTRHSVRVLAYANAGNHLHLHLQLRCRRSYARFVRAFTSAAAYGYGKGFWDRRPFSRIVRGEPQLRRLEVYFRINVLQGLGYSRSAARQFAARLAGLSRIAYQLHQGRGASPPASAPPRPTRRWRL